MTTDLQEAFREAARREFAMVPDENELDYTFSPGFQRKMQRIIRAQVHGYWNMVNTLGKRIAIAATIIVMLLTTAMAIKPIRERVIKFFVEIYEEYYEIRFGKEEKDDLDPTPKSMARYRPSILPSGYIETSYVNSDIFLRTEWQTMTGNKITLRQEIGTHEIILDNSGGYPEEKLINGQTIRCMRDNNTEVYLWEHDGYIFYLTIHDTLSFEEISSIIISLENINN